MSDPHADDIVRLADAANPQEAYLWCQVLEEEGIKCKVVGDYLEAGFGDVSYFNRRFRRRYGLRPSDVQASRRV